MKILYVSDHPRLYTGLGVTGRYICDGLSKNHEVKYIGLCPTSNQNIHHGAFEFDVIDAENQDEDSDRWAKISLPKIIKEFNPDVVITAGEISNFKYVPSMNERKDTYWIHWIDINGAPIPKTNNWLIDSTDGVVTCSDWARHRLVEEFPHKGFYNIFRGVDRSVYKPLDKTQIRKDFGCDLKFVIGVVCKNELRENIPAILSAFSCFMSTYTVCHDCEDFAFGETGACEGCGGKNVKECPGKFDPMLYLHTELNKKEGWDIKNLVRGYGLDDYVRISPKVSQIGAGYNDEMFAKMINSWDVLLSVSGGETFNMPVLQAMACGVPTIAIDYSGHVEYCSIASLLVCPNIFYPEARTATQKAVPDTTDLLKALDMLYYDDSNRYEEKYNEKFVGPIGKELRDKLGNNGIFKAKDLDWAGVIKKWEGYLGQLDLESREKKVVTITEML